MAKHASPAAAESSHQTASTSASSPAAPASLPAEPVGDKQTYSLQYFANLLHAFHLAQNHGA